MKNCKIKNMILHNFEDQVAVARNAEKDLARINYLYKDRSIRKLDNKLFNHKNY